MVKICFCLNTSTRLQGIIQSKSASGSPMLPLVIFDKKRASFSKKLCYFKVFLGITSLKVPFLKDSWCCPKILDHQKHKSISMIFCYGDFFKTRIHYLQGWTATAKHGVTRKRSTKRLKHAGSLFRKNLQLKDAC